ncbi:unnamed protein product [Rotaria magnacalcarata]
MNGYNQTPYRLGRRPGKQGPRPLPGNQGRVEKLATGKTDVMTRTKDTNRGTGVTTIKTNDGAQRLKITKDIFTVGTWNVQTLWTTGKLELLRNEMKRFRFDVVGISEDVKFTIDQLANMIFIIGFVLFLYIIYGLYQHFFPASNIDPRSKYVLISGCDSGFGNALAIEFDKQGFNVFAGIYSADSKSVVTEQLSSRATIFLLDITRQEDIDSAYEMIKKKTNTLHALVNNAGISTRGHIDWITMESMRQLMDVNFFGHVAMTQRFLPLLITKRDSRVVNISSAAGLIVPPSAAAYCASKYALESFSDCLRREMFAWGLRVSIIEPGLMRTPIIQKRNHAAHEIGTHLSADVRERWGEEFLKYHSEHLKNNIWVKLAEDPIKVVRAVQHAVMSTAPYTRYRPGWQSMFVYFPLSIVPAWLADLYFEKMDTLPVLPVGINNQMKS